MFFLVIIRYERRPSPPRREYYRREDHSRNLLPWEKANYRRSKPEYAPDSRSKPKPDKTDEYKKLCKAIENDMERILKQHKKNPEKHPQYNDEWKKFWNRRYKELQGEGKDVSNHDFKPEWIEFWNKRMIELHQDEIKAKKDSLRKRLGLPDEPAPISFKISGLRKKMDSNSPSDGKPVPPSAMPDNDPEVIVIEDKDDESKSSRRSHSPWEEEATPLRTTQSRDRSREPISKERSSRDRLLSKEKSPRMDRRSKDRSRDREVRKERRSSREMSPRLKRDRLSRSPRLERDRLSRSPRRPLSRERDYKGGYPRPRERIRIVSELPWERNKPYKNEIPPYYKPPTVMRDVTREPVLSPPPKGLMVPATIEAEADCEINVVSVLRLLTALEEKLGSLGPKIIDLLAQALAMEKNEANSSDNLLDNDVNCVLFETVKEKLKGQFMAGLVEHCQAKAFKIAIQKTASLIHLAEERKREKEKNQAKVDPVKVPGVGTVDKAAIARQIANALVHQGKTDVTQEQLEQLVNAVVGMAEASKHANKPMTTAAFLEQITKAGSSKEKTPPPKELAVSSAPIITPTIEREVSKSPEKISVNSMEGLSDSDLQTLLQNFKDLSTEEQHGLINYLKKLEAKEPDRVERLRKFVNLGGQNKQEKPQPTVVIVEEKKVGRESPFSNRLGSLNPTSDNKSTVLLESETKREMVLDTSNVRLPSIDSDEEDYSFDDVVKAASKNVKEKELEKEKEIVQESMKLEAKNKDEIDMNSAKALISNIMSNINKEGMMTGLGSSNLDLANIPINMASLANIVGSVQNLTKTQVPKVNFQPIEPQRTDMMGFMQPHQSHSRPFQAQSGPVRSAFEPSKPTTSYEVNYGGQNMYQGRPNITYPLPVDKPKMPYPNYGGYGGQSSGQFPGPVPAPNRPVTKEQLRNNKPPGPPQYGQSNNFNKRW